MNTFKFLICFENEQAYPYITEKLGNAWLAGCIPIYWGTSKVVEDFNPSTFINCNDFENSFLLYGS